MLKVLKVVIADDHPVVRDGLNMIFSIERDIEVVGTARNGIEAVELVNELGPDVVLMDMYMPEKSGIEALVEIKKNHPTTKVLMISSVVDDDLVIDCLSHDASGVLLKDWPTERIIYALKESVNGQLIIPESYSTKLIGAWKSQALDTQVSLEQVIKQLPIHINLREEEVLLKIMEGKKNKDIARELFLSIGTVKNYLSSLYKKVGVTKRDQLIQYIHNQIKG